MPHDIKQIGEDSIDESEKGEGKVLVFDSVTQTWKYRSLSMATLEIILIALAIEQTF